MGWKDGRMDGRTDRRPSWLPMREEVGRRWARLWFGWVEVWLWPTSYRRCLALELAKMGRKNAESGTFEVCFTPKKTQVGSPIFSMTKIGAKTPKSGTFEVYFTPNSPQLGLPSSHEPKWVKKPQNRALLKWVLPSIPPKLSLPSSP